MSFGEVLPMCLDCSCCCIGFVELQFSPSLSLPTLLASYHYPPLSLSLLCLSFKTHEWPTVCVCVCVCVFLCYVLVASKGNVAVCTG